MRHLFLVFLFGLSTIWSCSPDRHTDLKIFKYNQTSGITSLDPAFAKNQANIWAASQFYNGLVQLDNDLLIQPAIAKSWDFSQDGLQVNFHLRTDVYFHEN